MGAGIGGELIRRYRAFKARRRAMPVALRNAGFWTDGRVYLAELIFCVLFVALPFTVIVSALASWSQILPVYAGLLAYSLLVFLIMKSLNTREPQ